MKLVVCLTVMFAILLPVNTFSGVFGASNYFECILEEMPGVKNDAAAMEIARKCAKKHSPITEVEYKSPIFGVKTAGECVLKYAKNISSPQGAARVKVSCYKLYPDQ